MKSGIKESEELFRRQEEESTTSKGKCKAGEAEVLQKLRKLQLAGLEKLYRLLREEERGTEDADRDEAR